MNRVRKMVMAAALGSVALSGTAQAACWTPAEVDAAKVRDLQSRMMVAALRCTKSNHDLLPEYNRFVREKRSLLKLGNGVLRSHFAKGRNSKQALRAYDRYAVSLANRYGAGSGDLSECKHMKVLVTAAVQSDSRLTSLVNIAQQHALSPELPGGRCGIVMASKGQP